MPPASLVAAASSLRTVPPRLVSHTLHAATGWAAWANIILVIKYSCYLMLCALMRHCAIIFSVHLHSLPEDNSLCSCDTTVSGGMQALGMDSACCWDSVLCLLFLWEPNSGAFCQRPSELAANGAGRLANLNCHCAAGGTYSGGCAQLAAASCSAAPAAGARRLGAYVSQPGSTAGRNYDYRGLPIPGLF